MNLVAYFPAEISEENFVNSVNCDLSDIKCSFFKIGCKLIIANQRRYYISLGFDNIVDAADALFGLKKSTTYELMSIAKAFCDDDNPMILKEVYASYSQSQLAFFTTIKKYASGFINLCKPDDTIEKMRKAKKCWDKISYQKIANCYSLDDVICAYEADNPNISDIVQDYNQVLANVEAVNSQPIVVVDNSVLSEAKEKIQENSEYPEKYEGLCRALAEYYKSFNGAIHQSVLMSDFMRLAFITIKAQIFALSKNRSFFKYFIRDIVSEFLNEYNYFIKLHDRKQGNSVFANVLASVLTEKIIESKDSMF